MFDLIKSRSLYGSIISDKSGAGIKQLEYFTHPDMNMINRRGKGTSGLFKRNRTNSPYRLVPITSTVSLISFSRTFLNPVFASHFFISCGV